VTTVAVVTVKQCVSLVYLFNIWFIFKLCKAFGMSLAFTI